MTGWVKTDGSHTLTKLLLGLCGMFALFLLLVSPLRFADFTPPEKATEFVDTSPEAVWLAQQISEGRLRPAYHGEIVTWLEAEPTLSPFDADMLTGAKLFPPGLELSGSYVILAPVDFNTAPPSLNSGRFLAESAALVPGYAPRGITIWSISPHQCFGSSCR
ncbi:hypothetical protein [Dongia sp.]|uniref:hypothetical protein n=1 Tax=Dongia sp. TaxID=1977262 RepID=UPI0035AD8221